MSRLTTGLFTSNTDEWATPQAVFDELNSEFHFTLDPCATPDNAKCPKFYTKDANGLLQNWGGKTCSATHHTERQSNTGCGNAGRKAESRIREWLCSYLQRQIRHTFTIIFTTRPRSVSSEAVCISVIASRAHRSRV